MMSSIKLLSLVVKMNKKSKILFENTLPFYKSV